MSEPTIFSREEMTAILQRIGVKDFDEAFLDRCIEVSDNTRKTLSMLPPPPDKAVEPAHVFAVPQSKG